MTEPPFVSWPRQQRTRTLKARFARLSAFSWAHTRHLKSLGAIPWLLLLLLAYVLALYVPLPHGDSSAAAAWLRGAFWPWQAVNLLISGGALGRLAILSVAPLAVLLTRNQAFPRRLGFWSLTSVEVGVGLLMVALATAIGQSVLTLAGFLPAAPGPAAVTFGLLFCGSMLAVLLDGRLQHHLQISLLGVNSLIILADHLFALLQRSAFSRLVLFTVVVLFYLVGLLWGRRRRQALQVVDRRTGAGQQETVVIPYGDNRMQRWLLFFLTLTASTLLLAASLLPAVEWDLSSPVLMVPVTLALSSLIIWAILIWRPALARVEPSAASSHNQPAGAVTGPSQLKLLLSSILVMIRQLPPPSAFPAHEAAAFLHGHLWMLPNIRPGQETVAEFHKLLRCIANFWLRFFLISFAAFWLLEQVAMRYNIAQIYPAGGPVLLLILLTFAGNALASLFLRLRLAAQLNYNPDRFSGLQFISRERRLNRTTTEQLEQVLPEEVWGDVQYMLLLAWDLIRGEKKVHSVLMSYLRQRRKVDVKQLRLELQKQGLLAATLQSILSILFSTVLVTFVIASLFALLSNFFESTLKGLLLPVQFQIDWIKYLPYVAVGSLAFVLLIEAGRLRLLAELFIRTTGRRISALFSIMRRQ